MPFPFNLHAVEWAAHLDAFGKSATEVPEWLASLADEQPLVREEAAIELQEAFAAYGELAPVAPRAVEPLLKLVESEPARGRGLAAMLLAHLALGARLRPSAPGRELLEALEEERASLETLAARHAASTPLGAALRALIAVLASSEPVPGQLHGQLEGPEPPLQGQDGELGLQLEASREDGSPLDELP